MSFKNVQSYSSVVASATQHSSSSTVSDRVQKTPEGHVSSDELMTSGEVAAVVTMATVTMAAVIVAVAAAGVGRDFICRRDAHA